MADLFKTREYNKRSEKPDLQPISLIIFLCGLILYVLWPEEWYAVVFFVPAAALFYFQRYYVDSGRQKLYGSLGRYLTFASEGVRARGRLFPYAAVENLVVEVNDFDRERQFTIYTVSVERGVNNRISFRFQDQNHTYPFYIESQAHQQELRTVLDALLASGVKIKVYYKGHPSTVF
ncbi:hypothetical protein [Pontibacter actiniarum]|uniref:Uncharacterized protein n=1 Tax=Pontibacter actiniarum TaxID=323450 RepID=A0A1X9YP95_9BACT|nr:hypothetical protein [Pontibacter actiniarum]ARS34651.1 hypothetical protein CA264_03860 [Pontibacter actiniarum]